MLLLEVLPEDAEAFLDLSVRELEDGTGGLVASPVGSRLDTKEARVGVICWGSDCGGGDDVRSPWSEYALEA